MTTYGQTNLPTLYPAFKIAKNRFRTCHDSHEIYLETLNQFFQKNTAILKSKIFKLLIKFMKVHGKIVEKEYSKN